MRFKTIIYDKANTELFAGVYENNLYELTFQNIKLMINSKYEENNLYNIEHKNYTVIQTKPDSPLAMYIETYINEYISSLSNKLTVSNENLLICSNGNSLLLSI